MRSRLRKLERKLAERQGPPSVRVRLLLHENGQWVDLITGEVVEPSAPRRIVLTWEDEAGDEGVSGQLTTCQRLVQ